MNKKAVVGTAAVLLVAGYGAATWYLGERAHGAYQEALQEMRTFVGPDVLVSEQYTKGFWSSQGQLVLQVTMPVSDDEEQDADEGDAAARKPIRITVENTVRHGPLAGWRLAAAVIETRLSSVEGVDDGVRKAFAKVSAPTLTTVRKLTGSHDFTMAWPAGEVGDGEDLVRWQPLVYQMSLNADRSRLSGDFAWPEFTLQMQHDAADSGDEGDGDDEPAPPPGQGERFAMALQGMKGDFNAQLQDGLWLLAPGSGSGTFGKLTVTRTAAGAGAAPEALVSLQDLTYRATIERTGAHLGWVSSMQGKGSVGSVALESLELNETVSRIDIEALKLVQKALLDAYKVHPDAATAAAQAPWTDALMEAVPKFVAALPAYAVKLSAKVDGEQGELQYGIELKSAPDAQQIAEGALGAAMLKSSAFHASLRLPKAWLPRLAQAAGTKAPKPEDIDAMVGMAQAQGFVKQDGAHLTSAMRMEDGKVVLNGKEIAVPMGGR